MKYLGSAKLRLLDLDFIILSSVRRIFKIIVLIISIWKTWKIIYQPIGVAEEAVQVDIDAEEPPVKAASGKEVE